MKAIVMKVWDFVLGVVGFIATISLKDALSYAIGFATLALLLLRIYVTWKHRNTPPKAD